MKLKLRDKGLLGRPWLLFSIIVSLACAFFMMFVFNYIDTEAYLSWSVELLDCIFRKTTMGFYEYSGLSVREVSPYVGISDKSIPMLLPIAIWDIPVWIAHEITGNMIVTGFWELMWMKLGFMFCIILTAIESAKIVKTVNPDADHLLVYPLIFASFDILCSTMYAGQDEIVYLLMLVIALRFLVQDKIKWYLLFASFAVVLNIEMLLPVLIMTAFFEKRIIRLILYMGITYIPTEIFNLLYRNNTTFHEHTLIQPELIKSLFTTDVAFSQEVGNVSLFLFVICVLLFFTFTKKNAQKYDLIWIMAVLMISRTLLCSGGLMNFYYRSIMYVPFAVILIVASRQVLNTNLIVYGLYACFRGWMCIITNYPQNMSMNYLTFDNEYVQRVLDKNGWVNMAGFYGSKFGILNNYGIITVVCLALAFVLLFINHRSKVENVYEILNAKKDIVAFAVCLFVPLVIAGFVLMYMKADRYSKRICFGSTNVNVYTEDFYQLEYDENEHIHTFPSYIVYEDNICVTAGEDKGEARYLYPHDGMSFGPYIRLYPGTYRVTIAGQNLENAAYDCTYSNGVDLFEIPLEVVSADNTRITYTISVDQTADNVETRIFNQTDEPFILYHIDIDQIR